MRWLDLLSSVRRAAHLMVGVADYDTYRAHREAEHPGEQVMRRRDFHRERMDKRYGGRGMSRCC